MKKIKPMHDYVLVKVEEKENVSEGGIILAAKNESETNIGVVVDVGSGNFSERLNRYIKLNSVLGTKVIFSRYGHQEIKVNGEKHYLIPERSLSAYVVEE